MVVYHSVNHLVHEQVTRQPDTIVLGVPDKTLKYTKYTYKELDVAACLLAKHYVDSGLLAGRAKGDNLSRLVVGFLCQSGFDYVVNELALNRLGYCILLISPNNSPAAVVHLLSQTHAESIIASESLIHVVEAALSNIPADSDVPSIIVQPSNDVYGSVARQSNWSISWEYPLDFAQESELPFVIIHSSGSTGHPKPISISHRAAMGNFSQNLGYPSFTTLPLYHNHGHSNLYRAFHSGKPFYLFPAGLIPMTVDNILTLLTNPDCDADAFYAVPLVLTFMVEREKGIEILRRMKAVMYAGSALSDETGDRLVAAGVKLIGQMGTTEIGQIGTSARDFETDKYWNYVRAPKHLQKWFRFDDQGDGTYELVVLKGYPTKVTSNQPDGSFRTKDLYIMHPTLEWAFKFCGRLDDTLVMINGEKTNPVPIELCLRGESPYIADAILFGAGRAQVGALILPSEKGKDKSPAELQTLIAPALAAANADAPSHSQLAPEALVFLPYGTPIPRADKGSFIRARTYATFAGLIDDVYRRLEGEVDTGVRKRRMETLEEGRALVGEIIKVTLWGKVKGLTDETDLFVFGLDSLQAARIRNAIQRSVDIGSHKLPSNFVFDHPSVNAIAHRLLNLTLGHAVTSGPSQTELMRSLVGRFASDLPRAVENAPDSKSPPTPEKCVLLTGATGSLGAYLLNEFLADSEVTRVYCLARASSHEAAVERVAASMALRGLNERLLAQRQKVRCLAADFAEERLRLSEEEYGELCGSVSVIIHSAWPVNFNLGITSFEPHIAGAVNLMRLAHETRLRAPFYFCSSISAVLAWPGPGSIPEEVTSEPAYAQGMGYARSKWVVERLCMLAGQRVLRIGQLVGDSRNGVWNESEAISLMIKGAQTVGVMPDLDESPAWLPVDTAARVIHEIVSLPPPPSSDSNSATSHCWHVVQPKRVPWSTILDHLAAAGLTFKRVSRREWLDTLRASDADPVRNPTIKLLAFFEEKYGESGGGGVLNRYPLATAKTEAVSAGLRGAPWPDEALVRKWVESWRRTGFLR